MSVFIHGMGDLDALLMGGARGGGATVTISDTEPEDPPDGTIWFDWSAPALRIRYDYKTWIELLPTLETPAGPPEVRPPPCPGPGPGPGPGPTAPWASDLTLSFPGTAQTVGGVLMGGSPFNQGNNGIIPLTALGGWDPAYAADFTDANLYPTPPHTAASVPIKLYATYVSQPEVQVDFDWTSDVTPTNSTPNKIMQWGFSSGDNAIYIQGNNGTGAPIALRLEKP